VPLHFKYFLTRKQERNRGHRLRATPGRGQSKEVFSSHIWKKRKKKEKKRR